MIIRALVKFAKFFKLRKAMGAPLVLQKLT